MNVAMPLLALGLVLGGGIGFTIAAANGVTLDGHDHGAHGAAAAAGAHDHGTPLALAEAPGLAVTVTPDPVAGWNVHVETDLAFSPENASGPHVPGEGHAHIYANGVKLARVYGPWTHLDALPEGEVVLEVTLNANDHRPFHAEGRPVAERVTIQVP